MLVSGQMRYRSTVFLILIGCICSSVYSLKCYQCQSRSSHPCPEEDLQDCPATQAFDRCSLKMKKSVEGFMVTRGCTLAPCNLRDKQADSIIQLRENCKMDKDEYDCMYCCKDDGCNKDGGSHLSASAMLLLASFLLIVQGSLRL